MTKSFIAPQENRGTEKSKLGQTLEVLATGIAEELLQEPLPLQLEGLKVLTNYYSTTQKLEPPFENGAGFDAFRQKLAVKGGSRTGSGGAKGKIARALFGDEDGGRNLVELGIPQPKHRDGSDGPEGESEQELSDAFDEDGGL